jgi:PTH1 family peptidyl-tRNA hydrolase
MIFRKLFNKMESEIPAPFLIAGLGNPGPEYRETRHNIGFMALDRLADRLEVKFSRLEFKALVVKTDYEGQRVVLAKPHTFMNLSGQAVGALVKYYKIPLSRLLIAYDEIDLPFGILRLRPGGGSAGHKGMASIIERLGSQEFPRMRIGVGRPQGRRAAANHVLHHFSAAEKQSLDTTLDASIAAILTFMKDGLDAAMNQFNGEV